MTPRVSPMHYKGVSFVEINALPKDQKTQFEEWVAEPDKINIETDNIIIEQCATYEEYAFWFENHYCPTGSLGDQI